MVCECVLHLGEGGSRQADGQAQHTAHSHLEIPHDIVRAEDKVPPLPCLCKSALFHKVSGIHSDLLPCIRCRRRRSLRRAAAAIAAAGCLIVAAASILGVAGCHGASGFATSGGTTPSNAAGGACRVFRITQCPDATKPLSQPYPGCRLPLDEVPHK